MMLRCAVLLLSAAFAGAPLAADLCAASCEAAHIAGSAQSSGHAGHHHRHASTAASGIGQAPQPCGHDHNDVVAITASSDVAHARPFTTANAAVMPASLPAASLSTSVSDLDTSDSPPGRFLRGFTLPIRI